MDGMPPIMLPSKYYLPAIFLLPTALLRIYPPSLCSLPTICVLTTVQQNGVRFRLPPLSPVLRRRCRVPYAEVRLVADKYPDQGA